MAVSSAGASDISGPRGQWVFRVRLSCFGGLSDRATLDDVVGAPSFVLDVSAGGGLQAGQCKQIVSG